MTPLITADSQITLLQDYWVQNACHLKQSKVRQHNALQILILRELLKVTMWQLAAKADYSPQHTPQRKDRLLHEAIARIDQDLAERVTKQAVFLKWQKCWSKARKQLNPLVPHLEWQSQNLSVSRKRERISKRSHFVTQQGIKVETAVMGWPSRIDGLLAYPLSEPVGLNMARIREQFDVRAQWFPFEVHTQDVVFVLDDDGSIFAVVSGLPPRLMPEAKAVLKEIAELLYTPMEA